MVAPISLPDSTLFFPFSTITVDGSPFNPLDEKIAQAIAPCLFNLLESSKESSLSIDSLVKPVGVQPLYETYQVYPLFNPAPNFDEITQAVDEGDTEVFRGMHEAGVNLNIVNFEGYNALHLAILAGQTELVKFLIEELHLELRPTQTLTTEGYLIATVFGLDWVTANYLIPGDPPIHLAARIGHLDLLSVLAGVGVDYPTHTNALGQNILHIAAQQNQEDVFMWAEMYDPSVGAHFYRQLLRQEDINGNTPLHLIEYITRENDEGIQETHPVYEIYEKKGLNELRNRVGQTIKEKLGL